MKNLLHIAFAAWGLLMASPLAAQSLILFQKTDSEAYLLKHGVGGPRPDITDHIMQRMAQGADKSLSATEIILTHDAYLRMTKSSAVDYSLLAQIQAIRATGDIRYRGIDMTEVLKPSSLQFTLERVNASGQVFAKWEFADAPLAQFPATIASFNAVDSTGNFEQHQLRLRNKSFIFSKEDKDRFDARTLLVDRYHNAVPELELIYQELKKVNPEDFEYLGAQQAALKEQNDRIALVRSADYPQKLALSAQQDPARFLPRMQEVENYAAELQNRIAATQANLHLRFYERGQAALRRGNLRQASNDFLKSLEIVPDFAPSYVGLAQVAEQEGRNKEASDRLVSVYTTMDMDAETRALASNLSRRIYAKQLANGRTANQGGNFAEAIVQLDEAAYLCSQIADLACGPDLDREFSTAHGGIYQLHLSNARTAMASGQLDQAASDIRQALDYQVEFSTFIPDPQEAVQLQDELYRARYERMLADGQTLLDNKDLQAAENVVREAMTYQFEHQEAILTPDAAVQLLNAIKSKAYLLAMENGRKALDAGKPGVALGLFDQAADIEKGYNVPVDTALAGLRYRTAARVVKADMAQALEFARSNRLQEAREIALRLEDMMGAYGLASDPELAAMRQELQDAIFSQECANAADRFMELVQQAQVARAQRAFLKADGLFQQALDHGLANQACNLEMGVALEGKDAIRDAVEYQQAMQDATELYENAAYQKCIARFMEAEGLFQRKDLAGRFGLEHPSLYNYIVSSGRLGLMHYGVRHFANEQMFESAVGLMRELVDRGYSKGRLKELMVRVGTEMATRDKRQDPNGDPKEKGLAITGGNKKLKKLYKAYKKQWKKL